MAAKRPGFFSLILIACLAMYAATSLPRAMAEGVDPGNEVLATVGGYPITARDLDARIGTLPLAKREIYETEEGRREFLRELVRVEVFSREAQAAGILNEEDFQRKLSEFTKVLLAEEYIKRSVTSRVTVDENDLRQYYDNHRDEFVIPEKIKASSIFIEVPDSASPELRAEKKAKAAGIIGRARGGEDFIRLAKEFSDSRLPPDDDYFARGRLEPRIENDVFRLQIGEISPVLQNEQGFLVFKLEDRIPARNQSYEEVRDRLRERVLSQKKNRVFLDRERELFEKFGVIFGGPGIGEEAATTDRPGGK